MTSIYPASLEIIVPARNEASRLPEGLAALCRKAATLPVRTAILVVDSASTDATGHVVRSWAADPVPVRLLRCQQAGKGIAVRAGLLATQAPFVGYCDADMATDLSALDTALRLLAAGIGAVIGSRALQASVVEHRRSAARRVGAATFRALARAIVPGVTDTQCGFKFFSGPLARSAARPLRTAGFAFDIELLANCLRLGASLTEIPVRWRDVPGSSFSVWRHSVGSFGDIASIWLRSRGHLAELPLRPPPAPHGPSAPAGPPGSPAPPGRSASPACRPPVSGAMCRQPFMIITATPVGTGLTNQLELVTVMCLDRPRFRCESDAMPR